MTNPPSLSRRSVLSGAAALGATAALVACGSDDASSSADTGDQGGDSPVTIAAADVPVGGGTIKSEAKIVVTQPAAGEYKAFSAVCPHQGCLVSSVSDSKIICACHQSSFSASDGSVLGGPANRALASKTVTLSGETLTVS